MALTPSGTLEFVSWGEYGALRRCLKCGTVVFVESSKCSLLGEHKMRCPSCEDVQKFVRIEVIG